MAAVEAPLSIPQTNGNGTNGVLHDGPVEPAISFDPALFRSYLLALLPPVVGAALAELEEIFDDDFDERVQRFAGEGGGAIYVVKKKDDAEGESICTLVTLVMY